MSSGRGSRIARIGIAAALLTVTALVFTGSAAGQESLANLEARMETIQGNLDASTLEIERLRDQTDFLASEIARIKGRSQELEQQQAALSKVSSQDADVFVRLSRTQAELEVLDRNLESRQTALDNSSKELAEENKDLQKQFREVASEYQTLRRKLASAQASSSASSGGGSSPSVNVKVTGDMTCPVAGPVSFVDSWGAPRSGHTHQGVDMMADYGTPLVAVASGTASYVAYDGSGGNMIFLDGDDGNSYWYMHNQENLVSVGQHVEAGEQIATVGDTGNASGTSHVHFEYHPGGGEPVNPYPLVAPLC